MLNPHVFPIVGHPGPAPEVAARSGQGLWEPYALAAPNDRLLPFVVTRLKVLGQGTWLNCATIVDADTEEVLFTLTPSGPSTGPPPSLGLVLDKVPDGKVEHFIYYGALIPDLELPCGRPLRLLLDKQWQSARFVALRDLSGYQRLEWSHPGPLSGVPYGSGFVQRLFCENGGLQAASPREVEASSQDAVTGGLRTDFLASYARRTANVATVPRYLYDALMGARLHKSFTVDWEAWRLTDVKPDTVGVDGGRWNMTLTVEAYEPLQSRASCLVEPLMAVPYNPATDGPRAWRCGDASDTAADYQPTGTFTCEADASGNTGVVNEDVRDVNIYSPTFGQTTQRPGGTDFARCPLPIVYYSELVSGNVQRNDCDPGSAGSFVPFTVARGQFSSRISQADANQQAQAYYDANAQDNANTAGTCSVVSPGGNVVWRPIYEGTGCFTCQMENANDLNDVRSATALEISMYSRQYADDGVYLCTPCS